MNIVIAGGSGHLGSLLVDNFCAQPYTRPRKCTRMQSSLGFRGGRGDFVGSECAVHGCHLTDPL